MCANPVVEEDRAVFREKDSGRERKLATAPLSRSTKALMLAPLPKTLHPHTPCDPSSLGAAPDTVLDPLLDLSCPEWSVGQVLVS